MCEHDPKLALIDLVLVLSDVGTVVTVDKAHHSWIEKAGHQWVSPEDLRPRVRVKLIANDERIRLEDALDLLHRQRDIDVVENIHKKNAIEEIVWVIEGLGWHDAD